MAGEAFSGIYCAKMTIGRLHIYLASTERGALRVGLGLDDHLPPAQFFRRVFPDLQLIQDLRMNQPLADAVEACLHNKPPKRHLPLHVSFTPFQKRALEAVAAIPFGQTRTYGAVASAMGSPQGARAVGQVMGRNPLPLIFP